MNGVRVMAPVFLIISVVVAIGLAFSGCDYSSADVQVACEGHQGVHQFAPSARAGRPDVVICKDGTVVEVAP